MVQAIPLALQLRPCPVQALIHRLAVCAGVYQDSIRSCKASIEHQQAQSTVHPILLSHDAHAPTISISDDCRAAIFSTLRRCLPGRPQSRRSWCCGR